MVRGRTFSAAEERLLLDNYDLTVIELEALFIKQGYNRSRKSINRKLEKFREEGKIGPRSKETVDRSYFQRGIVLKRKPVPEEAVEGFKRGGFNQDGFDRGGFKRGGFDSTQLDEDEESDE